MKKYKSTIQCAGCIATVTPVLNEIAGVGQWAVDTASPSKILTIQGEIAPEKVAQALAKVGYKAEPIS